MKAQQVGKIGEDIAAKYFKDNNYKLLGRNIRFRFGEIDLMLEKNGVLIFCEVKTRRNEQYGAPFESVTRQKLRKMQKAIHWILAKNPGKPWQCDVVSIVVSQTMKVKKLQHFENILA